MKTALLTGANGALAQEIIDLLNPERYCLIKWTAKELDVTNKYDVHEKILRLNPKIVFHFAAKTDVDWCENHPDQSFLVNAQAVFYIAKACKKIDSTFVFPSTYYVFSGLNKSPIDDRFDQPILSETLGIYAKHKLIAEQMLEELDIDKKLVVRLGSLFGGKNKDKKFVHKILELAKIRNRISVVSDRFIQPSYSRDSIKNLLTLIDNQIYGTYNMVGHGITSYFEYAKTILDFARIRNIKLSAIPADTFIEAAPRSRKLEVRNGKLIELGLDQMRDWKVSLEEYITHVIY